MSRKQAVLLVVLAAALAAVILIARANRRPPFLPPDPAHASFTGAEACLGCHARDAAYPQSPSHPNGFDCMRCHAYR
ncbi:MAG TPA: hypothetical protein VMR65_05930 [Candidatus Sulfotelmatobacter sp.]|nr:hypothetical protein [Candidatus Sulfotelmatobacter sp.]